MLTGAIGTGKSTVGSLLAARGARVVDADRIGHAVIEPDGPAFADVAARWPDTLRDGRIDRRALGRIVFSSHADLQQLEAYTHPHIVDRLEAFAAAAPGTVTVVEVSVPHLGLDDAWRRIVVVAPVELRHERLLGRGMEPDEVESRMAAQPPAEQWLERADVVIDNGGDLERLSEAVDAAWESISNV